MSPLVDRSIYNQLSRFLLGAFFCAFFCLTSVSCTLYKSTDRDDFNGTGKANAPSTSSAMTLSEISCAPASSAELNEVGLKPGDMESTGFSPVSDHTFEVYAASARPGVSEFRLCRALAVKNSDETSDMSSTNSTITPEDEQAMRAELLQAARLAP